MVLGNFLADADILWDRAGKKLFEKPEARTGRIMRVQVTNRGVVENLTGYTLNLGWKSTIDETKFGLDAFEARDITKGIFELEYTSGMLTNIGTLKAALQLVPVAGNTVESDNFVITVTKSAVDAEAIQSESSFSTLTTALVQVNGWNATIGGKISDWEDDMAATKQLYIDNMEEVDATYPIELNSVKQQLADTLNKSAITLTHMFADNTARDAYFVTHPAELVDLQFIKVGTGYQQYIEGAWQASTAIVAEQLSATNQPIADTGNYFATDNTNAALQELGAHKSSTANPHSTTKAQVGLGNVDNTSDANKPISIAGQTALNLKANKTQEAWITPTLINGWLGNWYSVYGVPQYFKDEFGFVHIRGSLSGGASGDGAFTMPSGYRPTISVAFTCPGVGTASGTVVVTSNGDVRIILQGAGLIISGIKFKV